MNNKNYITLISIFIIIIVFVVLIVYFNFFVNKGINEGGYLIKEGNIYLVQNGIKNQVSEMINKNVAVYLNNKKICNNIDFVYFLNSKEIVLFDLISIDTIQKKYRVVKVDLGTSEYVNLNPSWENDDILRTYKYTEIEKNKDDEFYFTNIYFDCITKYKTNSNFSEFEIVSIKYDNEYNKEVPKISLAKNNYKDEILDYLVYFSKFDENYYNELVNSNNFEDIYDNFKEYEIIIDKQNQMYAYQVKIDGKEKYKIIGEYQYFRDGTKFIYNTDIDIFNDKIINQNIFEVLLDQIKVMDTLYVYILQDQNNQKYILAFELKYI